MKTKKFKSDKRKPKKIFLIKLKHIINLNLKLNLKIKKEKRY